MNLKEIIKILEAEVLTDNEHLDREIKYGCGCDLMSDVLAFAKHDALLLTGLTNPQSVRAAEMADIACVCYVRGKRPPEETIELAREKEIPLLLTRLRLFDACGRLYQSGLSGIED